MASRKMIGLKLGKENDDSFRLFDEPEIVQACFLGEVDKVRSIIHKQKDDINLLDSRRRSPLHAAAFNSEPEIVNLLLLSGARPNVKDSRWLTPLHRACRSKSSATVKALLEHSGDVVARDKNWQTPLHVAAANNAIGCAELLIPHLVNINVADRPGKTPLHHAAINGHVEMLSLLLDKNANVNAADRSDRRPLHWAAFMGHSEVVKILLNSGAEINLKDKKGNQAIHFAAASGHVDTLLLLIDAGCNVNVSNVSGDSPLHLACVNHHTEAVNELLMNNADPHLTNSRGYSCLHYISPFVGSTDILAKLILEGCDINRLARNGQTPLHIASHAGRLDHCQILIRNGAWVECEDQDGNKPLHLAAYAGHSEIVSLLIENGAKYKSQGQNGMTAMHMAASSGEVDCVKLLLSKALIDTRMDFEIDNEDAEGRTCLHLAALSGNEKCVDLLIKAGSELNASDNNGRTPLHYAANLPSLPAVISLLKAGANINCLDRKRGTPLHYASCNDDNSSTVECLLQNGAAVSVQDEHGFTPIHYATMRNQISTLHLLLDKAPNHVVYKLDQDNTISPLHLAAYHGHDKALMKLLEVCDKNVNVVDPYGRTPLSLAALKGHINCVETLLIQANATVLTHDNINSCTPFHSAACNGHANCLRVLIKNAENVSDVDSRDKFGRTPLMYVTAQGHLECLNVLLNSAVNVNLMDDRSNSALHRAAALGYDEMVGPLLKAGANAKLKGFRGRLPVHMAAAAGHATLVQTLIAHSPQEDLMLDNDGFSPLHWSAANGFESCLDILMQHNDVRNNVYGSIGISISSSTNSSITSRDSPHTADMMLKRANLIVQYFNSGTTTPLHCAASQENVSCTEMLIEKFGQKIMTIEDGKGRLPIHVAAFCDSYETLIKFLCSPSPLHEQLINARDVNGNTPLTLAAMAGKVNSIQLLIESDAIDLDACNDDGDTALHLACANSFPTCAELLLPVPEALLSDVETASANGELLGNGLLLNGNASIYYKASSRLFVQNNSGETALHLAAKNSLVTVVQRLVKLGASLHVLDKNGYSPALACCQTQEAANCLQLILEALLPRNTATGGDDSSELIEDMASQSEVEDGMELNREMDDLNESGSDIVGSEQDKHARYGSDAVIYSDAENSIDSETF